jgi:hypothetical protein
LKKGLVVGVNRGGIRDVPIIKGGIERNIEIM